MDCELTTLLSVLYYLNHYLFVLLWLWDNNKTRFIHSVTSLILLKFWQNKFNDRQSFLLFETLYGIKCVVCVVFIWPCHLKLLLLVNFLNRLSAFFYILNFWLSTFRYNLALNTVLY